MSDLETIIQKVGVSGQEDVIGGFESIASAGTKAIAALSGASGLSEIFGGVGLAIGGVTAAIIAVTYEMAKFAETQNEAQVALGSLAEAAGATRDELKGLEGEYGQFGVNAEAFARGVEKMAIGIAASWAGIAKDQREAGTENEKIAEGIRGAQISVAESFNRAQDASEEWADKLQSDANSVAEAFQKVIDSGANMQSQISGDALSVRSAELGLEQAQAALSGDKAKQAKLAHDQLVLGVDQAQQRLTDAKTKQTQDSSQSVITAQSLDTALEQALHRQSTDTKEAPLAIEKSKLDYDKAITAQSSMQNTAYSHMINSLENIVAALSGKGPAVGLTDEMNPARIREARELLASQQRGGGMPSQLETEKVSQDVFRQGQLSPAQMNQQQRLDMGGRGSVTAQEVAARLRGDLAGHISEATEKHLGGTDAQQQAAEHFIAGTEHFSEAVDAFKRAVAGDFAAGLRFIVEGKKPSEHAAGGLIRIRGFADGGNVGDDFATRIERLGGHGNVEDRRGNKGSTLIDYLGSYAQNFAGKFTTGLGALGITHAKDQPTDNLERDAGLGDIKGAGTGTSDSILARLSHGEFVVKAAAVSHYGAGLFHALNNMSLTGFAAGGLASRLARQSDGAMNSPGRALNLTIGSETFHGLSAPESVADRLIKHSISTQTSSAGRKPSWVK